jgi:hypothetical protein
MPRTSVRPLLDPESRGRLQIFTFKLLGVIPFSMVIAAQDAVPPLQIFAFCCFWHATFAGLAALVRRQHWRAVHLTAWDETAAFSAIALLVRFIGTNLA